ncbi:MAG: hypothetical protein KAR06_05980 [Deltaproteobacteria bacterium]|nr:hypothetical protein [Deltaproteobacteria bacterium]
MRKSRLSIFVIAAVFAVFAYGCSGGEEKAPVAEKKSEVKEAMPTGHPSTGQASPADIAAMAHGGGAQKDSKPVQVSDEVKAKWKEVTIGVKDLSVEGSEAEVLVIAVGEKMNLKVEGYSIEVEAFLPDYAIFDDHVGSRSVEPKNPAVLVKLYKGEAEEAAGWIFKNENFRTFNTYKSDRFMVSLSAP